MLTTLWMVSSLSDGSNICAEFPLPRNLEGYGYSLHCIVAWHLNKHRYMWAWTVAVNLYEHWHIDKLNFLFFRWQQWWGPDLSGQKRKERNSSQPNDSKGTLIIIIIIIMLIIKNPSDWSWSSSCSDKESGERCCIFQWEWRRQRRQEDNCCLQVHSISSTWWLSFIHFILWGVSGKCTALWMSFWALMKIQNLMMP